MDKNDIKIDWMNILIYIAFECFHFHTLFLYCWLRRKMQKKKKNADSQYQTTLEKHECN